MVSIDPKITPTFFDKPVDYVSHDRSKIVLYYFFYVDALIDADSDGVKEIKQKERLLLYHHRIVDIIFGPVAASRPYCFLGVDQDRVDKVFLADCDRLPLFFPIALSPGLCR